MNAFALRRLTFDRRGWAAGLLALGGAAAVLASSPARAQAPSQPQTILIPTQLAAPAHPAASSPLATAWSPAQPLDLARLRAWLHAAPAPAADAPTVPAAGFDAPPGASPDTALPLQLKLHHSLVVNSLSPLTRVSLTDDSIAQAIVVSPYQVVVQGHAAGEVSLITWDATGATRFYTVQVGLDTADLNTALATAYPKLRLTATANSSGLVLSGTVPDTATAKQVLAMAAPYSTQVVDDLGLPAAPDPGQVLLQVRFAEVDRTAISQFGANLLSTGAGNTVGSIGTQQYGAPSGSEIGAPPVGGSTPSGGNVVNGAIGQTLSGQTASFGLNNLLNIFLFRSDANLGVAIEALQQQNLIQILAEPNLVAMDGKDASFLAGGEFPFPVVQGTGGLTSISIEFKPFGVNLHFKPTILADGTIDLAVAPEVSALDYTNSVTISGFTIPALSTRRAQTELELADGQSFVIAGLLDNRLTNSLSKLPGLGDLPVLGQLFASRNFNKSKSELMVVVTAHLVQPLNGAAPNGPKMPAPFLNGGKFDQGPVHGGGH